MLPAVAQAQFDYTTNADGISITITGYSGSGGAVIIPATIGSLSVTGIGESAFNGLTALTSVTIPDSVANIGDGSFSGCTNLTSVTIPNSVTNIGEYAFYACSLANLTLGTNLSTIGDEAFGGTPLTSVTIPERVTYIGDGPFSGCSSLTAIAVPAQNSFYSSVNGVLFDKNLTALIQYPGGLGGAYAIPNSVNYIGASAFSGCTSLTSVTIPASVTSIGGGSFTGCTNLTNVTIPGSVLGIGPYAFYDCWSLTNVTMGDGVQFIGQRAFNYCYNLHSLTIPASMVYIQDSFWFCYHLNLYFEGGPPIFQATFWQGTNPRFYQPYFLPGYGVSSWGERFASVWYPTIRTGDGSFGVQSNQFGFNISWASGQVIVVEASTYLTNPVWTSLQTNTLSNGSFYFSEPFQSNTSGRFYRLRMP